MSPGVRADGPRQPLVTAGPYRVGVDRITQSRTLMVDYSAAPGGPSSVKSQRTIQLQVAVFGDGRQARDALATFEVKKVVMERAGRSTELPHYGGPLEMPNDPAFVRGYLYVPSLPPSLNELRSVEGEIVAYENTAPVEIEIPVAGPVPHSVEKDGIKVTLREWASDGGTARLLLWVEAPASSLIVNTVNDGSYGVSLLSTEGRPAVLGAGGMQQVRSNQAEYRMVYSSLRGTPDRIRLKLLHRAGPKRVYPFKIERIPIPAKSAP